MTGMTTKSHATSISGDTEVGGVSRSRLLGLLRSSDFSTRRKNQELLPLSAADRASRRPLTKIKDEETITIHRPGRSTYPEAKSVLTSGATPERGGGDAEQIEGLTLDVGEMWREGVNYLGVA